MGCINMENSLILNYALNNYKKMLREPDGSLKYKFIVPGSVYSNTLWDWDCWLTDVALSQFVKEDISEYETGCVLNYLENMDSKGRIHIFIDGKFSKERYENWGETNIHKPCLAQHTAFIIKKYNKADWIAPYFDKLCKFVDYYINNCRHETGIYFWIDDGAIGVDNDPSTFYRPNKSSGSIFLNCFMYKELKALCFIGETLGKDVTKYNAEAKNLRDAVLKHCYDEKDGTFYSVDLNLLPIVPNKHAGAPRHWDCIIQRIGCWSSFLPLWCGIATPTQAERMVKENLLDKNAYWAPFGVRSLAKYEKMYTVKASGNPSCWLGPVWGISNYLVFKGLVNYGYIDEARELAQKNITLFENDLKLCGDIHEYYDPESGEPIMNAGFQNWNLLSINMRAWLNGEEVIEEF